MKKEQRAKIVAKILDELYPKPPISLYHKSAFGLLVAVVLSAQSTDKTVNRVVPGLFKLAPTPLAMSKLTEKELYDIIKPCGLGPRKAKGIIELSKILVAEHKGRVPRTFEELEALPCVGHKSASVVMSQAFHIPAFAVDTHITRLAQRWKLSSSKNVKHIEADLKSLYPEKEWNKLHLQMVYYGREYCPARNHVVENCPICSALKQ